MKTNAFLVSVITLSISFVSSIPTQHFDKPLTEYMKKHYKDPFEDITTTELDDKEYDFIVVGSGSAGAVVANRLSEVKHFKILLLEAGHHENFLAELPILTDLIQLTDYNWGYLTEPQENICGFMKERRCTTARGKALGGTSVINTMIYSRGHPADYNKLASLGNPGWSYEEVLPYFLKSEDSHVNNSNEEYHNVGGYLSVSHPYVSELGNAYVAAGQELGYNITDYNSPDEIGFSKLQSNLKQGRRHSTGSAFVMPILHRKNLQVLTGAMVTKILINASTKAAYGVQFDWRNKSITARAKKEVILSAGVYNSPQLLMLSGVGPKSDLEELGIELLVDLPVGQSLYNHLSFQGFVVDTNLTDTRTTNVDPLDLLEWYNTGEGYFSSTGGTEALGFVNTGSSNITGYPDVELVFRVIAAQNDSSSENSNKNISFVILSILLHPQSKGFMKLKSGNPYDYPLIYGNYLTDEENQDIRTLTAGIRFALRLLETNTFKKYNATLNKRTISLCNHLPFDSDEYWQCAVNIMGAPVNHQIATCKMGPSSDPTTVVNHELKVHGLDNLRVVDTSVIPVTISGHTHAPAVMVGEKASDLIKESWDVPLNIKIK